MGQVNLTGPILRISPLHSETPEQNDVPLKFGDSHVIKGVNKGARTPGPRKKKSLAHYAV